MTIREQLEAEMDQEEIKELEENNENKNKFKIVNYEIKEE